MDHKSIELIIAQLDKLGTKLGIGIETIWPWFMRQVYIKAAIVAIVFMVVTTGGIILLRYTIKHWDIKDETRFSIYERDLEEIFCGLNIVSGVAFLIFGVWLTIEVIHVLNPEYAAFENLLDMLRGTE